MREIVAEDQPFVREEHSRDEGLALFADQPYKREIIEGVDAELATEGAGDGVVSAYRNTPDVRRPVPRSARARHRPARALQAHARRGRLLARRREAAAAPAHLRHRVGVAEGARRAPPPPRGGGEARPPQARRRARPVLLPRRDRSRPGGLAPEGRHGAQADGGLLAAPSTRRAATSSCSRRTSPSRRCGRRAATSTCTPTACTRPWRWRARRYYPKPMNCPFHMLIYRSRLRSYRELPLRLFEFGTVYRYERSGVLHGLMRVRGMTQDDSHIFCTREQIVPELTVAARVRAATAAHVRLRRSSKPSSRPGPRRRRSGSDEDWRGRRRPRCSRPSSRRACRTRSTRATARSTGPRSTCTCATPSAASGSCRRSRSTSRCRSASTSATRAPTTPRHRPVMIHRALFGSVERFFGILLEHYAGAFPVWLAPVQARVLPVARRPRRLRLPHRRPPEGRGLPGRHGGRGREAPARASARPSSRSCPTCSSSATTTSRGGTVGVNARAATSSGGRGRRVRRPPARRRPRASVTLERL